MDFSPETPMGSGGVGKHSNIHEDSFLNTPVPQASSTVDRLGTKSRIPLLKDMKAEPMIGSQLNHQVIAYATDQKQALSKKLEIIRSMTNKDRKTSLQNDLSSAILSEQGSTSSLGILDVDSLEDFADETNFIRKMLERSASLADTSSSYPESNDMSNTSRSSSHMSTAEAQEEQCVYIAADMVARKERALALDVLRKIDDSNRTSSCVPLYLLQPNESMESYHSRAAIPDSLLESSSFNISHATCFDQNRKNRFLSMLQAEEDAQDSFSAEQFIAADSTQAAAQLLADDEEIKRANDIAPLTTQSINPDMSQLVDDRADITVNTTSLGCESLARVSVDEFFRMRSEDTGSLDVNAKCTRPSFGTEIASPLTGINSLRISPNKTSNGRQAMVNLQCTKSSSNIRKSLNMAHSNISIDSVGSLNNSDRENKNPVKEMLLSAMSLNSVHPKKPSTSDRILQENTHILQEYMSNTVKSSQKSEKDYNVSQSSTCLTPLSGSLLSFSDSVAILNTTKDNIELPEHPVSLDQPRSPDISSGWIFIDDEVPTTCNDTVALVDGFTHSKLENLIYIETETGNNTSLDFGLLPESCSSQMFLTLSNQSDIELNLLIAIKSENKYCAFSIVDDSLSNESILSCQQPLVHCWKAGANEKLRMLLTCCTPTLQELGLQKSIETVNLKASLCVFMDTPQRQHHLYLKSLILEAQVGRTGLSFDRATIPLLTLKCELGKVICHPFPLKNTGTVPLDLSIEFDTPDGVELEEEVFSAYPKTLTITPGEEDNTMLRFAPCNTEPRFIDLRLIITIEPNGHKYESDVLCVTTTGRRDLSSSRNSSSTNKGSVSSSSKGSSDGSVDGALNIKSTHSTLSWTCIPLGKSSAKTFTIKNFSEHSAKFYAVICDNSNSFKFKNEQGDIVNNRKLVLSSNEGCKISVIFHPSKTGAFIGSIKFASSTTTSDSSQQINLYGYGGYGLLNVEGIPKDGFGRMWLNMGIRSYSCAPMQARFRAHNTGNLPIFAQFKILPKGLQFGSVGDSVFAVVPSQVVIAPGGSDTIRIIYQPQPSHETRTAANVIELAVLHIVTGDEPTRFRLRQVLERFPNMLQSLPEPINIKELTGRISGEESVANIHHFREPESVTQALCHSLVLQEVSVIVERSLNESHHDTRSLSCLENSTRLFVTLHGEMEETSQDEKLNDSSSWSVFPAEIKFSLPTNASQTITVQNSSTREQTFEVEVNGEGLEVRPSGGLLPSNGEVNLHVFCTAAGRAGRCSGKITILMENTKKEVKVSTELDKKSVTRPGNLTRNVDHQATGSGRFHAFASTPYRSTLDSQLNTNNMHGLNGSVTSGSALSSISMPKTESSREKKSGVKNRLPTKDKALLQPKSSVANQTPVLQIKSSKDKLSTSIQTETNTSGILPRIGNMNLNADITSAQVQETTSMSNTDNTVGQSSSTSSVAVHNTSSSVENVNITDQTRKVSPSLENRRNQDMICGVFSENYNISFPPTMVDCWSSYKITLKNTSNEAYMVNIKDIKPPFYAMVSSYEIKGKWFLRFKVFFKPTSKGKYKQYVTMEPEGGTPLKFLFSGSTI